MHPSVERLLQAAQEATKGLPKGERVATLSDLQTWMDVSPQTLSNWKRRGVSVEGALKAEELFACKAIQILDGDLSVPPDQGWLNQQHANEGPAVFSTGESHPVSLAPKLNTPLYTWEALMRLKKLPKRFRVQLGDQALAPDLLPGDELLMDSTLTAAAGDLVLLRAPTGALLVRMLRLGLPDQWDAIAVNPAFAPLNTYTAQLEVLAVSIGETRHRRRAFGA